MSVIAVDGLPSKISLFQVNNMLGKAIQGRFEALNFANSDKKYCKMCYLELAKKLDPVKVIERINNMAHGKKKNVLKAFIPDSVPKSVFIGRPKEQPVKAKKRKGAGGDMSPAGVLFKAHTEIMIELQHKYTGLYSLSSKGSHALLEAIGMTIYERLKQLVSSGDEDSSSSFMLTGRYRKAHPHFGDFQLILGTLHRLEDAAGAPRTQLQESELIVIPKDLNVVENVPFTTAQEAVTNYTEKIMEKLQEHVDKYDLAEKPDDGKEEIARKKVQTQLTKMMPYLPLIMKQVVTTHFADDSSKFKYHRMRMYGEPYLPGKELTLPLMKRHLAQRVSRWKTMYNMLVFDVPLDCYSKIIALDGTNLGGSKLVIRSSNTNVYRTAIAGKKADTENLDFEEDEGVDYSMEL